MKKITIAALIGLTASVVISSCGGKGTPGRTYMPDMAYSRAYEAYAYRDTALFTTDAAKRGGNMIYYNSMPVAGTLKRGEMYPYALDSSGYAQSASVKNPITDTLSTATMAEAGRLYNINCGICHGEKGAGNGPLATGGKIGGVANLTLPNYVALSDGTMFHVMTYGKGIMGSYASQLTREQRWQVVKYVRTLQNPKGATAAKDSTGAGATKTGDTTAVAKAGK
jgi:mono/diheme cytochrome c family protein